MYSRHAQIRCQQRGISKNVIEVLLSYGTRRYRHGAEVCFMDRPGRRRAAASLGSKRFAGVADRLDCYLVLSDEGTIITAAPRVRRMKF